MKRSPRPGRLMLAPLAMLTGMATAAPLPAPAVARPPIGHAVEDGPDLARRAKEDADIAAAADVIARCEARLGAAAAAIRLDLPPRLRTRVWWTPVDPTLAARATEVADRARGLAAASFTELLTTSHPAVERLQAQATVIRAVADALADRVADDQDDPKGSWLDRLARLRTEASDGPDRTSALDGPTLLLLAASALATPSEGVDAATAFHQRAGTVPDGIDALEYALVEAFIKAGGLDATRRRTATADLLKSPQPAPDRLLLGAIHLDAELASGRTPQDAIEQTIRVMLPSRGVDAGDRVRVVRAFAPIADAAVPQNATPDELPQVAALARLAPIVAAADPQALTRGPARALIERAITSSSPDVRAEAWLDAATIRMRGGDATGALDAIIAAIEASPRHPKAEAAATLAMRLADRIDEQSAFDAAVGRLIAGLPDHPQRHDWSLRRGDRALAAGDRALARSAWSAIPASADVGVDAGLRVLTLDADILDDASASRLLERLDRLEPRVPADRSDRRRVDADLLRIRALIAMARTTSAADVAARFVNLEAVPAETRLEVARIALPTLDAAGRSADADRMRASLARIDPSLASRAAGDRLQRDAETVLAAVDRDARDEARTIARTALDGIPIDTDTLLAEVATRPDATIQTAWLLAAAGRTDEARRFADAVVAAHPSGLEGLFLQAVLQGGRLDATGRTRPAPAESDAAAAVRSLSRINAGSGRGSRWWWRSEIEKLEILAALGRDLAKIDARLERLETEFRDLGGPGFERRVRSLRASIQGRRIRE